MATERDVGVAKGSLAHTPSVDSQARYSATPVASFADQVTISG